jgi:hypothetical protein
LFSKISRHVPFFNKETAMGLTANDYIGMISRLFWISSFNLT